MIRVDLGNDLIEILKRAIRMGRDARLDVAVPFYDVSSTLMRLLVEAVNAGVCLRLLTRPEEANSEKNILENFEDAGAYVIKISSLHAKSMILSHVRNNGAMGWIGSHNFTQASERSSLEMGISLMGNDPLEISLMQQVLLHFDVWEKVARCKARKFKIANQFCKWR
jgi:HKD family nuclease